MKLGQAPGTSDPAPSRSAAAIAGAEIGARTAVALLFLPLLFALLASVGVPLALLGAPARVVHRFYLAFARAALRVGGTGVRVQGLARARPATAYVVVCNHESAWDPICLVATLPQLVLRFVVKQAAMRLPIFGPTLRATGNMTVSRTDTAGDVHRIEHGMDRRDLAVSVLFFAEGTRARDGALHPFKKGAFVTAIHHRLPVLPVGIAGAYRIWPKGRVWLRPGPVEIEVGEPIPVEGLTEADRDALRERCFSAVRALRASARERVRRRGVEPGGVD